MCEYAIATLWKCDVLLMSPVEKKTYIYSMNLFLMNFFYNTNSVFGIYGNSYGLRLPEILFYLQIITADSINLYSVRLRDRGVDCRGFVQLPTVLDSDGNITLDPVDPGLLLKAARCYVDSCSGKAPGSGDECSHVRAAIACTRSAEPLEITASGIDAVAGLPDDVRSTMLSLITESPGPVVQRVTRNIMVVRCHVSYQHPLGFLHFTFPVAAKDRADRIELQRKVICGCRMLKVSSSMCMKYKTECH